MILLIYCTIIQLIKLRSIFQFGLKGYSPEKGGLVRIAAAVPGK